MKINKENIFSKNEKIGQIKFFSQLNNDKIKIIKNKNKENQIFNRYKKLILRNKILIKRYNRRIHNDLEKNIIRKNVLKNFWKFFLSFLKFLKKTDILYFKKKLIFIPKLKEFRILKIFQKKLKYEVLPNHKKNKKIKMSVGFRTNCFINNLFKRKIIKNQISVILKKFFLAYLYSYKMKFLIMDYNSKINYCIYKFKLFKNTKKKFMNKKTKIINKIFENLKIFDNINKKNKKIGFAKKQDIFFSNKNVILNFYYDFCYLNNMKITSEKFHYKKLKIDFLKNTLIKKFPKIYNLHLIIKKNSRNLDFKIFMKKFKNFLTFFNLQKKNNFFATDIINVDLKMKFIKSFNFSKNKDSVNIQKCVNKELFVRIIYELYCE